MNTGIWSHPEWYPGMTSAGSFKEFQELEHQINQDVSQCPRPCAPGECHWIFRWEGCDSIDEWMCNKPDNSLAYKCCCEYFHDRVNTTKPTNPTPALSKAMGDAEGVFPILFCTAMCLPHSYEVELLRAQYAKGKLGLFGCNSWAVYSNISFRLSPELEYPPAQTDVIYGSLASKMIPGPNPKDPWTASNTEVFLRFWLKVTTNQNALKADWTVKVDPDTVFMPGRLRSLLLTDKAPLNGEDPEKGFYLNDCHVGMHGPIEVLSRNALKVYKARHALCEFGTPADHGQEDWFLRDCFALLGVEKVDAFNLLFEGMWACQERASSWGPYRPPCFAPQVAWHPFKDVDGWMHCHTEAANHPWALPSGPMDVPPGSVNEQHG
mmetsp:Transcript_47862/g.136294  ORF Transcript_47862/g.136294 Transcript_47862/m.136294 type:complete len:379 (+) Transcript_47862:219-1355(+)